MGRYKYMEIIVLLSLAYFWNAAAIYYGIPPDHAYQLCLRAIDWAFFWRGFIGDDRI